MSPASSGGADELCARLESLLEEARRGGRLADLRPLLERALAEPEPLAKAGAEPELPGRFGIVGASPPMLALFDLIERAAPSDVPVLIVGETGTGKELVARALHERSRRRKGPFLAENCAAISPSLLESELFGHKRGSFTGAIADRKGHFVAASGGTLLLDEIGDMPLEMQVKLLRVLEEGEVRPVGASRVEEVDVRVLAATNRDLAKLVAERRFREDLYYRLNVVRIELPPLRERPSDVEPLVRAFVAREARRTGRAPAVVEPEALRRLAAAPWPGNVRQLENEVRRALALSPERIRASDLSPALPEAG
jgi:transcriptional regulator with GAF, ATPase, and Fis domain